MRLYLNNYYKLLLLLFFCLASSYNSAALIRSDSLKNQILIEHEDTVIIGYYISLIDTYAQSKPDSAMYYADKAFQLAEEIDNPKYDAAVNSRLGNMFFSQGNYGRAIEYYFEVLKYYEEGGNTLGLISPYFNIALVYSTLNDDQKAQDYYFKAVNIAVQALEQDSTIGKVYPIGRIYNNIGITYHDLGEYDKALDYYQKALSISEALNSKVALPYVYNNIGLVYQQMRDYNIALTFFQKSLDLRVNTTDLEGIALTYSYFGNCYGLMQENVKSVENYRIAYEMAQKNNFIDLEKNIAEDLVERYAILKDYESAYEMHLVYKNLSDSLDYSESTRTAMMLEQQYKFDKVQKELELKQQKALFRNIAIGAVMFIMLIILALLFFLTRSKVSRIKLKQENLELEKNKLEDELLYKNKELTTNVMYLLRKNELINYISSKLLELKRVMLKVNQDPIQKIINELQDSADKDIWKEFEFRFKDVHQKFYLALKEKFPELTPNERKLCAFLRLNMTTKEISAITFQSNHSITIARSRLRKKLNINNIDVDLVDFLLSVE